MPRFRDGEQTQKARRLLALRSVSLQLGQARKEGDRETLALAHRLGSASVLMDETVGVRTAGDRGLAVRGCLTVVRRYAPDAVRGQA